MAIIIEEEKKAVNWFAIGTVIAIVALAGFSVYYLFFINPELIEVAVPARLKSLNDAVQMKINPGEIFENPVVKNFKSYIYPITPEPAGNLNPFK